jgi:hypothetical protein
MVADSGIGFDRSALNDIDPAAAARGLSYHRQGRVRDIQIEPDGMALLAAVQGSEPNPYEVDITVTHSRRHGFVVEGFCTCPVAYNCKHVAAALYAVLMMNIGPTNPPKPSAGRPSSMTPTIPATDEPALAAWLSGLAAAMEGEDRNAQAPEHVRYILRPPLYAHQMPSLNPVVARTKRQGGLSQARSMTLNGLAQSTAKAVSGEDRMLARLVRSSQYYGYSPDNSLPDDPALISELLGRLLVSERLHWLSLESRPLRKGPALPVDIDWTLDDKGRQIPVLRPRSDAGTDAQSLDPGGRSLWYVDPDQGLCGPLQPSLPLPLARALLRAPPLDPVAASLVAQRLPALLPSLKPDALRLPKATARVETDDRPPAIRLRLVTHAPLMGRKYDRWQPQSGPADRAYLSFDYDGQQVGTRDGPPQFRHVKGDGVTLRPRRRDVENQALQRLVAAGLHSGHPPPGTGGKALPLPPGDILAVYGAPEAVWLPFLTREAPMLRQEGWQIDIDPDFRWQLAEIEGWEGEVVPAGAGWFDLDIGIRVNGQRIALLPLLLAMLKRLGRNETPETLLAADPGALFYAPLPDGQHVALPVARIVPLTRVLLDLFNGTGNLDGEGRTRIDLGQAALLEGQTELALLQPEQRDRLRRLLEPVVEAEPPAGLSTDLRPYQRRGLGWLLALDEAGAGGVLADDMGLGKTLQVIAFLLSLKNAGKLVRPALVLAPTSVVPNWLREGARHAPGLRMHLHHGSDRAACWPALDDIDLLVTGYPLLLRDHGLLAAQPWSALILDEAQAVKNQASKLAGLVRTLPAERRFCVTGTPLENHLGELWTQMDFVMPGLLGDSKRFTKQFRTPIEKQDDSNRRQLLAGRLRPFILRRAKSEVAADLPPKTEIIERIPLPDDQRDLYETLRLAMDAKVRAAIAKRGLARSHIVILEALLRLRQACCDPALLPATPSRRTRPAASAKRHHLMQMLLEMVAEGRRILLFSQFTSMLDLIRSDLDKARLRHVSLTGDTRDRMTPVDRFQAGEADIFLISLKAGGTGLTLTAADTVIHYDPWWNPAVEDQATDRAHRIGQDKPVFVYRLVADGTVEERMLDLQARKRQLAATIHDAGAESAGALTEADIDRLFAPIRNGRDPDIPPD